jgi:hypothetical protein
MSRGGAFTSHGAPIVVGSYVLLSTPCTPRDYTENCLDRLLTLPVRPLLLTFCSPSSLPAHATLSETTRTSDLTPSSLSARALDNSGRSPFIHLTVSPDLSFGAEAVLLYAAPHVPLSQPKNIIIGNTMSAAIGMGVSRLSTPAHVVSPESSFLSPCTHFCRIQISKLFALQDGFQVGFEVSICATYLNGSQLTIISLSLLFRFVPVLSTVTTGLLLL